MFTYASLHVSRHLHMLFLYIAQDRQSSTFAAVFYVCGKARCRISRVDPIPSQIHFDSNTVTQSERVILKRMAYYRRYQSFLRENLGMSNKALSVVVATEFCLPAPLCRLAKKLNFDKCTETTSWYTDASMACTTRNGVCSLTAARRRVANRHYPSRPI